MRPRLLRCAVLLALLAAHVHAQPVRRVALVGGTLIDGNGGRPIHNSVVLIEGDRIKAVGTTATLSVPDDADVISTEA